MVGAYNSVLIVCIILCMYYFCNSIDNSQSVNIL